GVRRGWFSGLGVVRSWRRNAIGAETPSLALTLRLGLLVRRHRLCQSVPLGRGSVLAVRRGKVQPHIGAHGVLRHTLPVAVHEAEQALSLAVALVGDRLQLAQRGCIVLVLVGRAALVVPG